MGDVRVSRVTRVFGQTGEAAAERYLRRKGYRILERNARSRYGELDLIAQLDNVVVFIEVKAWRTSAFGGAPYAVDARKQARLIKLAAGYLSRHGLTDQPCRFDVVLCMGEPDAATIEHIESAFEVPSGEPRW
jgi:putative endonuclease